MPIIDTRDGWWLDTSINIAWSPNCAEYRMNFYEATEWAKSIRGRLPTVGELVSLYAAVPFGDLPNRDTSIMRGWQFWSLDECRNSTKHGYEVIFSDKGVMVPLSIDRRMAELFVRAVRYGGTR